jgi:hypothetical protein
LWDSLCGSARHRLLRPHLHLHQVLLDGNLPARPHLLHPHLHLHQVLLDGNLPARPHLLHPRLLLHRALLDGNLPARPRLLRRPALFDISHLTAHPLLARFANLRLAHRLVLS